MNCQVSSCYMIVHFLGDDFLTLGLLICGFGTGGFDPMQVPTHVEGLVIFQSRLEGVLRPGGVPAQTHHASESLLEPYDKHFSFLGHADSIFHGNRYPPASRHRLPTDTEGRLHTYIHFKQWLSVLFSTNPWNSEISLGVIEIHSWIVWGTRWTWREHTSEARMSNVSPPAASLGQSWTRRKVVPHLQAPTQQVSPGEHHSQ